MENAEENFEKLPGVFFFKRERARGRRRATERAPRERAGGRGGERAHRRGQRARGGGRRFGRVRGYEPLGRICPSPPRAAGARAVLLARRRAEPRRYLAGGL